MKPRAIAQEGGLCLWHFLFLNAEQKLKTMEKQHDPKAVILQPNDAGQNLVNLINYLKWSEETPNPYPKWAKFDTATTMSDNNGGVIRF